MLAPSDERDQRESERPEVRHRTLLMHVAQRRIRKDPPLSAFGAFHRYEVGLSARVYLRDVRVPPRHEQGPSQSPGVVIEAHGSRCE